MKQAMSTESPSSLSDELRCSFCSKGRSEVHKLISGPRVYICDECVLACNQTLAQEESGHAIACPKPQELVEELDKYCIGQAEAKKTLAVAIYNHYKRIRTRQRPGDVDVQKGNILMIGPTGCGKTLLAQTLANKLDVPFAIADATTLTEAGYVGEDVESIIKTLLRNAGGDLEKAKHGIVFIDEIDKIARREDGLSTVRDVGGEGVQQGLLKLIEGKIANIPPDGTRGRPQQELLQMDTTQILFICSGAFVGLEDIIRRRLQNRTIGFAGHAGNRLEDVDTLRSLVSTEDLIHYGMIPEFLARLPILVSCHGLNEEALAEILWRPKNALMKQYQRLFSMEGIQLRFTDEAIRALAREAFRRQSGARGLRALLEEFMLDIMYELPSLSGIQECIIDENVVLQRQKPHLVHIQKAS